MTGYPYLLVHYEELSAWSPPTPVDIFQKTVCVKECPTAIPEGKDYTEIVDCKPNKVVKTCPTHKFLAKDMMRICVPLTTKDTPPQLEYYK